MKRTRKARAAGRAIELTVPLGPPATEAAEPIPDCEPAITGLLWFSDSTGLFDQEVEAAYLLTEGAAGPVLGVAGLVGEDCRLPVAWAKTWTPASGTGGEPGYFEDGARLVVSPLADTVPGVLEVTAEHDGQSYGPILLTVLRYSCYAYSTPCAVQNELGGWLRVPDNFAYDGSSGSAITQYGGSDGSILIGASGDTTVNYSAMSGVSEIYVYCNDGGAGYFIVNGDAVQHANARGSFAPPWLFPATPTVTVSGLSSLRLVSDGYGSPFYVFVR